MVKVQSKNIENMTDNKQLKKLLEQDIDWMWDEGFYTLANRLNRVLEYIEELENANDKTRSVNQS